MQRLKTRTLFQIRRRTASSQAKVLCQSLLALLFFTLVTGVVAVKASETDSESLDKFDVQLLHREDFNDSMTNWTTEIESKATIGVANGKLDINSKIGSTVWFNHKLSQPLVITYDVTSLDDGSDGLPRDHNLFWMASNPKDPNERPSGKGSLGDYDRYDMYYAGIGGNKNRTTRFRRYQGGNRVLKTEFTDQAHMNVANQTYHMKIVCIAGRVQVFRDGQLYWDFTDVDPYNQGWFGFRQTRTHLQIDDFKVYSLKSKTLADHSPVGMNSK